MSTAQPPLEAPLYPPLPKPLSPVEVLTVWVLGLASFEMGKEEILPEIRCSETNHNMVRSGPPKKGVLKTPLSQATRFQWPLMSKCYGALERNRGRGYIDTISISGPLEASRRVEFLNCSLGSVKRGKLFVVYVGQESTRLSGQILKASNSISAERFHVSSEICVPTEWV